MTHVWRWKASRPDLYHRRVRIICEGRGPGPMNILIETETGERIVAPRHAIAPIDGGRRGSLL